MAHQKSLVNQYKHIPVIGNWISRLGQIHDIFATPNTASPQIWVKAFFYAVPRLLWLPAKPFLLATEWHIRTSTPHRALKGIAKIGAEFTPKNPLAGKLGWRVFQGFGDLALKLEWYFMIIDRTLEFFVNWSSLAYIFNGQRIPNEFFVEGTLSGGLVIATPLQGLIGPFQCVDNHGVPSEEGLLGIPTGFSGAVKYQIDINPAQFLGIPAMRSYNVECKNVTANVVMNNTDSDKGEDGHLHVANADFTETFNNPPQLYGLFLTGDGAGFYSDSSFGVYAFKTGKKGLLFDP